MVIFTDFFKLEDDNNNPLNGVRVSVERLVNKDHTDMVFSDFTTADGKFIYVIDEGNAQTRYHSEKPIEYNFLEQRIKMDHEYSCVFEKDGYLTKDTTILVKNKDVMNLSIKLTRNPTL